MYKRQLIYHTNIGEINVNNTFKKRIDELGRIVIPKQIRNTFKIKDYDELELYIENDNIVMKKTGGIILIKEKLDNILTFIKTYLNIECIIIDNNNVISSNIENINDTIDFDSSKYLNNQEYVEIKLKDDIYLKGYIKTYQLIYDSNMYGSILFILEESYIKKQELLNDIVKIIIDLIK